MTETYFNIVVKKLRTFRGRTLDINKLKNIVHNILDEKYTDSKAYKMIYYLKKKGHLVSIKKDMILVKNPEKEYEEQEITSLFYRPSLKKHCKESCGIARYIGGIKGLELGMQNYNIPDEIEIYCRDKNAMEVVILDKKLVFKTYNAKHRKLRPSFFKHIQKITIGGQMYHIACLELALLESLYTPSLLQKGYIEEIIKQIIRKKKKTMNIETFASILKTGKHHVSINRLYQLALGIDNVFADTLADLIKKHSFIQAK